MLDNVVQEVYAANAVIVQSRTRGFLARNATAPKLAEKRALAAKALEASTKATAAPVVVSPVVVSPAVVSPAVVSPAVVSPAVATAKEDALRKSSSGRSAFAAAESFISKVTEFKSDHHTAVEKMQRKFREILYRMRVIKLHDALEAGDLNTVRIILSRRPKDGKLLDRTREFCTALHSALKGGSVDMVKLVGVKPWDVIAKDAGQHSCAHYAVLNPHLDNLKILYKALSSCVPAEQEGSEEDATSTQESASPKSGRKSTLDKKTKGKAAGGSITPKKSLPGGIQNKPKRKDDNEEELPPFVEKTGWLTKLSKNRWFKRWWVLKPDGLHYFLNQRDAEDGDGRDFLPMSISTAFFSRSHNFEFALVINLAKPSLKKERKSITIMASNERDMQVYVQQHKPTHTLSPHSRTHFHTHSHSQTLTPHKQTHFIRNGRLCWGK